MSLWKQITILMPVDTVDRVDNEARVADVDRSQLISQLVERHFIDVDITASAKKAQRDIERHISEGILARENYSRWVKEEMQRNGNR